MKPTMELRFVKRKKVFKDNNGNNAEIQKLAERWWINFKGHPLCNPGTNEIFKAWGETHANAYFDGFKAAIALSEKIQSEKCCGNCKHEGKDEPCSECSEMYYSAFQKRED